MRRTGAVIVCAGLACALGLEARQSAGQGPFRSGVDVIQIDVTVLDEHRRPVRGLSAEDFEVFEDGTRQQVVSFAPVEAAEADPVRSARMRFATPDVVANSLSGRLGEGRLFAIVLDDLNIPADDADIVIATREAARRIVGGLGPSDQAAVVYTRDAGKSQDYTTDQRALFEAIDRFQPRTSDYFQRDLDPAGGGDMPMRYSQALSRSPCLREQPAVPTLEAVTASLASVPGRRKTVFFLGIGLPVSFSSRDSCGALRDLILRDTLRLAQRANVNIYTIDPAGYGGYERYLDMFRARGGNRTRSTFEYRRPTDLRQLRDFMRTMADDSGGRAIIDTDAVLSEIDRVFDEDAAYYLIGYESTHGAPDGEFRNVEVEVSRPGVSVRHRRGYWAADADDVLARDREDIPDMFDPEMSGLTGLPGVPLRATAAAIAPASGGSEPLADVVVALSVDWPPLRTSATETLRLVRHVYDDGGRTGVPVQEAVSIDLAPGDESGYALLRRLSLAPGRHEVRFNVSSTLLDDSASIYVDVEVPRFTQSALSLSGVVLGAPMAEAAVPDPAVDGLLPVVPTTARDFGNGEPIDVFFRVYQGGTSPLETVTVRVEVFDAGDGQRADDTVVLEPSAFEADRGAAVRTALPLSGLDPGPHLLSVTAGLPSGRTVRREVLFRVR